MLRTFPSRMSALVLGIACVASTAFAATGTTIDDLRKDATSNFSAIIARYEAQIQMLQAENADLRAQLQLARGAGTVVTNATGTGSAATGATVSTGSVSSTTVVATGSLSTLVITGNETTDAKYRNVIKKVNDNAGIIFRSLGITATGATIGLFEFVEPNAFFISIDDGKNPAGETAFAKKALYAYNPTTFDMTVTGMFEFDFTVDKYVTKFGTNPYSQSARIRVKNPYYKGKLLDNVANVSSGYGSVGMSGSTSASGAISASGSITVAQIRATFSANRISDAVDLAAKYLADNPKDVEARIIRYRGLYLLQRYAEALAEVEQVRALQGSALQNVVACDGLALAKYAKDAAKTTIYQGLCKK